MHIERATVRNANRELGNAFKRNRGILVSSSGFMGSAKICFLVRYTGNIKLWWKELSLRFIAVFYRPPAIFYGFTSLWKSQLICAVVQGDCGQRGLRATGIAGNGDCGQRGILRWGNAKVGNRTL
jgi:hypothetical protein